MYVLTIALFTECIIHIHGLEFNNFTQQSWGISPLNCNAVQCNEISVDINNILIYLL